MDNNKLIAEFMGFIQPYGNVYQCCFNNINRTLSPSDMEFDNSWDWLMPVINKINNMNLADQSNTNRINFYLSGGNLEVTYEAVVEFIEWYNEND